MADNIHQIRRTADVMPMYGGNDELSFSEPPRESLVDILRDRFGGRWKLMVLIAVPLSIVCALVGWISGTQTYQSSGSIRIEPTAIIIREETPEHVPLFYEKFVQTQRILILQRRNLQNALNDTDLKATEWAKSATAVRDMERNLVVDADASSQMIHVRYETEDPELAQLVTDAVMDTYFDIYGRTGGDQLNSKLERLKDFQVQLEREKRSIHLDSQQIINRYASTDLNELHQAKLRSIENLDGQLAAGKRELRRIEAGEERSTESILQIDPRQLQELLTYDPKLKMQYETRAQRMAEFESISLRYRRGTSMYGRAQENAENADLLFRRQLQRTMAAMEQTGSMAMAYRSWGTMSPERIREEVGVIESDMNKLRSEVQQITADIKTLDDKALERQRVQDELDKTLHRITSLELESQSITGRISIAQEATKPLEVFADSRKKQAIFGFGFALFGTVGAFFVLGTVDRRTYGTAQLRPTASGVMTPPCLGVLPVLDKSDSDDESREVASHCVHQIRNQIEALRDPADGYVLAVSSPFQGDGKTSIVLALGWSYAAAGYRTVLVDCDLVGRSLTRQLGLVGESGLKESIASGEINGSVKTLSVGGLSALPAGMDGRFGPENIRRRELQKLFDELKQQYELIIVDTGPLLGSLESTPVSAAADGVLLTVRRGRSRTRLEECVNKLDAVGARCIGMVLNYAGRSDTYRYVSEASLADAEARAHGDSNGVPSPALSRTSTHERNALVLAMESTSRQDESTGPARESGHDPAQF